MVKRTPTLCLNKLKFLTNPMININLIECCTWYKVLSTSHSHAKKEPCGKPKSSSAVKPEEPSSLIGSAGWKTYQNSLQGALIQFVNFFNKLLNQNCARINLLLYCGGFNTLISPGKCSRTILLLLE